MASSLFFFVLRMQMEVILDQFVFMDKQSKIRLKLKGGIQFQIKVNFSVMKSDFCNELINLNLPLLLLISRIIFRNSRRTTVKRRCHCTDLKKEKRKKADSDLAWDSWKIQSGRHTFDFPKNLINHLFIKFQVPTFGCTAHYLSSTMGAKFMEKVWCPS